MKIAVTSAFGWPYVRRGNRVAYELASYLAGRGNEVHFITTKPGSVRREKAKGNLLIKYYPVIDNPVLTHFKVEYWQTFSLSCLGALLKEDYDIIHTSLTMDAIAAGINRSLRGTPFIPVLINGDPLYTDALRAKRLFHQALRKASRLVTISNFVNDILMRDYGLEGVMIPCPVDTSKFSYVEKDKTDFPKILCTATLIMERKRVPLLVKAFEMLIEHVPGAILQLAGETTPEVTEKLLMSVNEKTRSSIEIVDISSDEVLASFYRNATITVLPSLKEPFGMVTTESLASGTPVVGTRSGGTAEILSDPRIGVTFEPTDGPAELCQALLKCIELARDPETPKRCSEYAQRYSWNTLGPKYEDLHREVLNSVIGDLQPHKRSFVNKISEPENSGKPVYFNGHVDTSSVTRLFVDTLDELEITAQKYYQIERHRPGCVYVLKWLLNRKIRKGNILILSASPFLSILLEKLDYTVRNITVNNRGDAANENCDREISSDLQSLADRGERFGVIICDDIPGCVTAPESTLQKLRKGLSPEGMLIVTIPNINHGLKRNSLRQIEGAAANSGFTVQQISYITGEQPINKTNTFARVPLERYIVQKLRSSIERVAVSLRSHVFIALKRNDEEKILSDSR